MAKEILCCECKKNIPASRILTLGFPDEEIICGSCIKDKFGNKMYETMKSYFDKKEDNGI